MIYKIKTPNDQYNGVTEGVAFAKGIGYTEDRSKVKVLINDYKYTDATDYSELEEKARDLGEATKESANKLSDSKTTEEGFNIEDLTVDQLKDVAKDLGLSNYSKLKREDLIELIESASAEKEENDA